MRRFIGTVLINIVVFCVLAEAAALMIYYYQTGHLFYGHQRASQAVPSPQERRLTADALHPYFGPTHKPGAGVNNFGFVSSYDYPFERTRDNQFIIGIFGGSVGVWFCQLGADRLIAALRRNAFFGGRELVPLCFSHEGYKQPQQLLLLSYFLSIGQEFDLVIAIDGFNEVALGYLNAQRGLDFSMPSVMHLEPLMNVVNQTTLTPEKLRSLAEIDRLKTRLGDVTARVRHTRFASLHIAWEQYRKKLTRDYQQEIAAFAALPSNRSPDSVIYPTPGVRDGDAATLLDDIVGNWVRSSTMMRDLLAARNAAYFHFVQPNQYYTTRQFTDDEARVALNPESPFRTGAEKGYPLLAGAAGTGVLRENGVNIFSAVRIFDSERSQVYTDNCCHYTELGNRMLADFIARSILGTRGAWTLTE